VSVQDGSSTACSQLQSGSVVITVNPLPTALISGPASVCLNAPSPLVTFTGGGSTAPYTFTYNINGGANQTVSTTSGNSVTVSAPTNTAGTFTYNLISVQDGSSTTCNQLQPGSVIITVNPLPTASISGPATVCLNAPPPLITFTGGGSIAPYTFTYNINGGPNLTVTTTSGNSVTVAAPTNIAGTFTYNLVSVQDGSSTACSQLQAGSVIITVNPLPTALISSSATVCLNAPSPLVTFTGSGGTAPYTFTYNINGAPNQTVTTTGGNAVSIQAPTTVAGTFTYNLVSVQDASSSACSQLQTGAVTIKVNPLPTASISAPVMACIHAPSPQVTFTGGGSTAPYTFTYNINGGSNQTVTTTSGNTVSIAAPTNTAGTFTYNLVSVQDASSTACSQLQPGNTVVTINPLPNVFAGNDRELCQGSSIQLNAIGAAQYSWSPSTGLSCTSCSNPVANPTDTTQYIVQGTSSFGCIAFDTIKIIVIKPFPMFHSPDDTVCLGSSVMLNANGANSYLWSPAAGLNRTDIATPTATPTVTTIYSVVGYDGHNCFSDTAFIKVTVGPIPKVDLGPDLNLATGDIITLNALTQNGPIIKWLWEPATYLSCTICPAPKATVHNNIVYYVTVTNQYGCQAKDNILISTFCKSAQVFIPNAFTPDGDGYNDILMVRGKGIHVNYFRIFSRWGELVFEKTNFQPNDPQFGWDGKIRGILAPPDVFVYTAEVVCDNNVLYTLKGNTSLLK
jgi:gliding motility-associated-like protein